MLFWRRGKHARARNAATAHLDAVANVREHHARSRLTPAQRNHVEAALKRVGIGDVIERSMFLAALDYQLTAFTERLRSADPRQGTELLQQACGDAAESLEGAEQERLRALCEAFVAELARAYDACFGTPPTPELHGPFGRVLLSLCDSIGLALPCDGDLLDRAVGTGRSMPG
jgi:hypothetical protein